MRRRMQLNIAAAIFLLIAGGAVLFILQDERNNSFEIQRENPDAAMENNPVKEREEVIIHPEEKEEIEPKQMDLGWAMEKYKGREISKMNISQKAVALTFDAGANADGVEKVLNILEQNDIRGTFFLTGKFIERYPDKTKQIIATGGDLGNHSYSHPYFTEINKEIIAEELQKTESSLAALDARFDPLFRSPYGNRNTNTMLAVSEAEYINIRWTVDSLGWKGTSGGMTKNSVRDKVLKSSSPGAIIMMHLGSNPDDKTHLDSEALPEIIEKLRADGYEFVTLSELIEMEK